MTPRHCSKSGNSRSPIDLAPSLPSHHRLRLFLLFHQRPSLQNHLHKLHRIVRSPHGQSLLLRLQRMVMFHHDPNLLPRLSKTMRSQFQAQCQLKRRLSCPLQRRNVLNLLQPLFDPALQALLKKRLLLAQVRYLFIDRDQEILLAFVLGLEAQEDPAVLLVLLVPRSRRPVILAQAASVEPPFPTLKP
jgi:hypothetical protein